MSLFQWAARVWRGQAPKGKALGAAGERLAAKHLRRAGYRLLERNVLVAAGEADLVCLAPDRRTIVIVEVKTRLVAAGRDAPLYAPEVNIHAHKRRKLVQVARCIVARRGWGDRPIRIDVVAIEWKLRGPHEVRHHVSAVGG